jgi:hypothetical protein
MHLCYVPHGNVFSQNSPQQGLYLLFVSLLCINPKQANFMAIHNIIFRDITVKRQMENIPILIVGQDLLNDPSVRGSGHGDNTRRLCMYECAYHPLGGHLKEYLANY